MTSASPPSPVVRFLRRPLANVAELVFPRLCLLCDHESSSATRWLCSNCVDTLVRNNRSRDLCPRCALNRRYRTCTCEYAWDHPFDRIYALFDFDDTVKRLVHEIKYQGRSHLAYDLGRCFANLAPPQFLEGADAIAAVPLHFAKKLHRGYNQAERLARGVSDGLGGSLADVSAAIKRRRYTRTQTRLDREKRRANLQGAFVVPPSLSPLLKGRHLILVDDVVTTGSTTGVCARVLLEAGAASVRVLCLARD